MQSWQLHLGQVAPKTRQTRADDQGCRVLSWQQHPDPRTRAKMRGQVQWGALAERPVQWGAHPSNEKLETQGRKMSGSSSSRPSTDKGEHTSSDRVKTQAPDKDDLRCEGCNRTRHTRETCNFRKHPDFNPSGRWEGCKADRELRVRFDREREVKLSWKQRADGTRLTTGTSAAPDPPRHNDAPTPALQSAGDRDQRRRRDYYRRDRDRDRRDHGGRGGGGGRGQVHFEKDKGTPCLTSIITHLTCNCGGADINSTYRQCLVSILHCIDTV